MAMLPARSFAVALIGLALLCGGATAESWQPAPVAPESTRADVARALAVDPGNVVEAQAFDVPGPGPVARVYVGRYREHPATRWQFPAVVVDFHGHGGWYLSHATLGSAARRVKLLALVDLDAHTDLKLDGWEYADEAPAARHRRWPALVLVVERDRDEPRQTDLVIVSLRRPERPEVVLEYPLVERYADIGEAEMRAHPRPACMTLGHTVDALQLDYHGKVHRAVLHESQISSRWNGCLLPAPHEVTLVLRAGPSPRYTPPGPD